MNKGMKSLVRTAMPALAMFVCLASAQAFAQDVNTSREEIRHYQERVELMKVVDTSKYQADMDQINAWIAEGLDQVANKEGKKAHNTAMKIGVYLEYVNTAVERDRVLSEVDGEEAKLKALRAEYGKLEAEVQQLQAEQDVLNSKLESLKK